MSNKKLTGTLIPKDNKKAKMHATFYSDKPIGSGGDSEIFNEHIDATDQQRNTALANVSNQTANSTTGKMGYKVLDPTKTFAEQVIAENTIYEIRDVFDLNNGSVTIPAGCILKFDGGKIINGGINLTNSALKNGIFEDVCIKPMQGNVSIFDCTIIRNNVVTDIRNTAILIESQSGSVNLSIDNCHIENNLGSADTSHVYGCAIKLICNYATTFSITNSYIYCNAAMCVETQTNNSPEIVGLVSNNTVIADGTYYNMTLSFPHKTNNVQICNNNLLGGYVEVGCRCVIDGNTIKKADSGAKAISVTGNQDAEECVIISNNKIKGVVYVASINYDLNIHGNKINGGVVLSSATGKNMLVNNIIIKDGEYIVDGNNRSVIYATNSSFFAYNCYIKSTGGLTVIGILKNCVVDISNVQGVKTSNGGSVSNADSIIDNNYIIIRDIKQYYSSFYQLFSPAATSNKIYITNNTIELPDLTTVVSSHKLIYEYKSTDYTTVYYYTNNNIIKGYSDVLEGTTEERPDLTYYVGNFTFYDKTLSQHCYFDYNRRWRTEEGFVPKKKRGTTAERPSDLTSASAGFPFFDETLGKYICWNGSDWVNLDGTALS